MKIIDIAICTDNKDPKGMGRIRCVDYADYLSGKSLVKPNIQPWSEDDPFVALPFLPNNLNFVPEKDQAVKIIRYNTEKTTVNQEYIAGPFTTRFDFNGQTFSQQVKSTTYGIPVKSKSDIIKNGELPNTLSKPEDYSVSGKYGSDILFTQDGVVLSGGKLISKDGASASERESLLTSPIRSKKTAKLLLKKFPKKYSKKTFTEDITTVENADLKHIVEYSVDDFTSPTKVDIYVYRVKKNVYGDALKTKNFTEFSDITSYSTEVIQLLNNDGTTTTPTHTELFGDYFTENQITTTTEKLKVISAKIRTTIIDLKTNGIYNIADSKVKQPFKREELYDIHPFYFRPTEELRIRPVADETESSYKESILSGVNFSNGKIVTNGLVWSSSAFAAPTKTITNSREDYVVDNTSKEQTFSGIISDKMYLLSTDTNFTNKTIPFDTLNEYEWVQDDYLKKIDPNTYSLVRGEILLEVLRTMYSVLINHKHNINKVYAREDFAEHYQMEALFQKLEDELLNKSIRTN